MKKTILALCLLLISFNLKSQKNLLTTAESSNFQSTSTYEEVITFFDQLLESPDHIRKEAMAISAEGREIPLYIIADPMPQNPDDISDDERIVVYLQANIHAGEVEGKEAIQMLARDIIMDGKKEILKDVILLLCPVFNADGNEKFSTENRTNQVGPENGVGVRHNGQFLDLNRDAMKMESPEMRGLITNVFNRWDPAISVDCHTTNGSYHEEPVTFTWMMNPNGDRNLINFMRDKMMPEVHENLLAEHQVENVFYGEFMDRLDYDKGWISYATEPRYWVNYVGVRNRLAILNENYVYADFKTRILGSYSLLWTIVDYASRHKTSIMKLLDNADLKMQNRNYGIQADSFALEYKGVPTPELITIKAIEADTIPGVKGYWRYRQSDRKRTVTVPYIADYFPTNSIAIPFAYLMEIPEKRVVKNLERHGIEFFQLEESMTLNIEKFVIEDLIGADRLYQGHYMNTVTGHFEELEKEFKVGTYIIPTDQPLGNLAAYLLEPQSDDGYLKWNFFDRYLVPQWGRAYYDYPVYRVMEVVDW